MASSADTELSRELSIIINCAYPASLANVAHICSRTDPLTVRAAIHQQPPCAVAKLASILSDALPNWPCSLAIVLSLSHSSEFRNELLLKNPGLLDALLTKANASQRDFDQYLELCVVLLSHQLPEGVPLPASAQCFFQNVFKRALQDPNVRTLKPIYYMLNGACRGLLALLPLESRQLFDTQLCQILSARDAPKNTMLLLWCFGIVILAEHPEIVDKSEDTGSGTWDHATGALSTIKWTTASGRKIFGTTSSRDKMVTLACLSVIWATKGGVNVPDDEALDGIRIATRTLQFLDQPKLEQWQNADTNRLTSLPKLLEKIQRARINSAVQFEALYFYATIVGPEKLSSDLVALYEAALVDVDGLADAESLKTLLANSLPLFAHQMRGLPVQTLIARILDSTISPTSTDQMQKFTVLADALAVTASHDEQFRTHFLNALSRHEIQECLRSFLETPVKEPRHEQVVFCQSHKTIVHRRLILGTTSMLLTAILAADSSQTRPPFSLGVALVKKQQQMLAPSSQCPHVRSTTLLPQVSLFQQQCTPMSDLPLQDWRGRLRAELERQTSYQRDSVIRSVAQICHDLESRCETVEGPLRRERDKKNALEAELARLRTCIETLEQKRVDGNLFLCTLESEKARLEKDNDEISARLEYLRVDMEKANSQAENALHEAEEAHSYKEMQLRSTILEREEIIQTHQKDLETLRDRAASLSNELDSAKAEKDNLSDRYNTLQDRFVQTENEVEEQRRTISRLEDLCGSHQHQQRDVEHRLEEERQAASRQMEELARLKERAADLDGQLQLARAEVVTANERLNDLQIRHHELAQSSTEALQKVEAQYESDLEVAASKAEAEYNQVNAELQDAHDSYSRLEEANESVRQELERVRMSIPSFKAKIQELSEECVAKAQEIDGLRSWKNRVMTSMGMPPEPAPVPRTPHQNRRKEQRNIVPQTQNAMTKQWAMEHVADASFLSSNSHCQEPSGSTPKRAKPRPSFKVPSMHIPYKNKPTAAPTPMSKKSSPVKRSALGQVSPNRRHTTVGIPIPEQDEDEATKRQSLPLRKSRGSLHEAEQVDFDMDDSLASTPFTPGNFTFGTGRGPEEDVSTTEL